MASTPDATPPRPGGLWARLFGLEKKTEPPAPAHTAENAADQAEVAPLARPISEAPTDTEPIPLAKPIVADLDAVPLARPVERTQVVEPPIAEAWLSLDTEPALGETEVAEAETTEAETTEAETTEAEVAAVAELFPSLVPERSDDVAVGQVFNRSEVQGTLETCPTLPVGQLCPSCRTPRVAEHPYCHDCGWMFGPDDVVAVAAVAAAVSTPNNTMRLRDRYEVREMLGQRDGVSRFRAVDHGQPNGQPAPVMIVRGEVSRQTDPLLELEPPPMAVLDEFAEDEFLPTFDEPLPTAQIASATPASWPSVAWEHALLTAVPHPALPAVVDSFVEGNFEYLVEEQPEGRVLWDAWDDPEADARMRYTWLMQIAEALKALHRAGAIVEGLRPDLITVTASDQAILADLSELLPLPVPPGTSVRASLYTAPELILTPDQAGAQADLYSFGAMLYALEYLHHTLEEKDFERQFVPNQITDRFPDVHPAFNRLINKTFVRDLNTRFPTDEASKEDATGFTELIRTLDVCRRTFDNVRFDIAAWTTTGMVRTGNEDAFGLLHAVESRQDELSEYAVVLLADGMGGYEAGEVAAAMAIQSLRSYLLAQPMFAALAGKESPPAETFDVDGCKRLLLAALKHANKEVYTAARAPGKGRRGMGCTAEAVYIDNRNLIVGHVGDSRTYHLHQGRLVQLTRDQTLVNRLVELGQLAPEEAENHPRKNELQQAIGGQPDVEPGLYHGKLTRGDWVIVCSDGLTNHIPADDLQKMLMRETANSAEEAARRLLNLVNLRGATDNATIVVIRAS